MEKKREKEAKRVIKKPYFELVMMKIVDSF
jgi:hypothetical protein